MDGFIILMYGLRLVIVLNGLAFIDLFGRIRIFQSTIIIFLKDKLSKILTMIAFFQSILFNNNRMLSAFDFWYL